MSYHDYQKEIIDLLADSPNSKRFNRDEIESCTLSNLYIPYDEIDLSSIGSIEEEGKISPSLKIRKSLPNNKIKKPRKKRDCKKPYRCPICKKIKKGHTCNGKTKA